MSQERQQREIRFRAFKDFGEFKVMLEDITVHATSGMIGLHDDHLKEELEKVGWTINDAYQFENIKTKETIDHDNYKCYDSGEEYFWIEDAQVMQYTGLKDKNGKEIYEGDRVKVWTKPNREEYSYDGVVEWYLDQWIINFGEQKFPFNPNLGNWHGDCEVIGNIYQPELSES